MTTAPGRVPPERNAEPRRAARCLSSTQAVDAFATGTGPDIAEGGEHLVGAIDANDKAYPVGPGDSLR